MHAMDGVDKVDGCVFVCVDVCMDEFVYVLMYLDMPGLPGALLAFG